MTDSVYGSETPGVAPPFRLLDRLVHALLPAPCLGCGQPLPARGSALGLCAACRAALSRLPAQACAVCALPLRAAYALPAGYRCGNCRQEPPAFDRLLALWTYLPPLDAVVQALKFRRLDYLGRHLAVALAAELGSRLGETAGFDRVVPVPLHWRRRLARGYNQAERIARPLAGILGLPFVHALSRSRATPPQSRLGRTRRLANLRRAFRVPRPQEVRGLHLLLVDDVATTGATLDAAAETLKRAGAAAVTALVVARTPLDPTPQGVKRSP
ncbi:MAG TPA: ComF family protein [Thermoanaerobaculia bacterium]|nr:ComF family protein [Thermoanaerobaculia bacterium]